MTNSAIRRSLPLLALSLTLALLASACGRSGSSYGPDVWAVVDGREVRKADIEKAHRMAAPPPETPPLEEELLFAQFGTLDDFITQDILLARARAGNLTVEESEVDRSFKERQGDATEAALNEELTRRGITREDVRESLRRDLLVQKLLDRDVVAKVNVTDAEIDVFFAANKERFNIKETQYRLAQIVVTPARDAEVANRMRDDAATPEAARRKIEAIIGQLKGGANFAQVAADYSEDPRSAPQGGDLGFVSESQLRSAPAEMRDVVFKMDVGNVRTLSASGGYTIVLLAGKEVAGQRDLNSPGVRDQIRQGLRQNRDQLLRAAYIAAARSGAAVDHRLAKTLMDRPTAPPASVLPTPGK